MSQNKFKMEPFSANLSIWASSIDMNNYFIWRKGGGTLPGGQLLIYKII